MSTKAQPDPSTQPQAGGNEPPKPPEKPQGRSRRERGLPVFVASGTAPPVREVPVTDESLGENDVRAVITVKFTSRYGTLFVNEDAGILGGLLDPANKGHFARTVENSFKTMSTFVIQAINKTVEKNQAEKAKQPAVEENKTKPLPPVRLMGGSMGEPRVSDMLPQAMKPGGPLLSALTAPPKN